MSHNLFYHNQERDEYVNNGLQLTSMSIYTLPPAGLMERTLASLGFFQNILKTESSSALQIAWTVFLREMTEDMKEVEMKMLSIQRSCKLKDEQLLENANAFEELQSQLESEQKAMLAQEREVSDKIIADLKVKVNQLEVELFETMEMKNDLVNKFNSLFRKKKSSKKKKEQLFLEVEDLAHEVELQREVIAQLKMALNRGKSEMEEECLKSYQEGYKYGRSVATEEEIRVLEQFNILREIEATLAMDFGRKHLPPSSSQ